MKRTLNFGGNMSLSHDEMKNIVGGGDGACAHGGSSGKETICVDSAAEAEASGSSWWCCNCSDAKASCS